MVDIDVAILNAHSLKTGRDGLGNKKQTRLKQTNDVLKSDNQTFMPNLRLILWKQWSTHIMETVDRHTHAKEG